MNYKFQKKGVVQKYTKTSFLVVAIMMSRAGKRSEKDHLNFARSVPWVIIKSIVEAGGSSSVKFFYWFRVEGISLFLTSFQV